MNTPLIYIPLLSAVLTALCALSIGRHTSAPRAWRRAGQQSLVSLVLAGLGALAWGWAGDQRNHWLRLDAVGVAVHCLVTFIGWVIIRFSSRYLLGERQEVASARQLLVVLAGVQLVLISNHLLMLFCAWSLASRSVQALLLFYRERPAARIAAHKRRVLLALADGLMLGGCALLALSLGSLQLDALAQAASAAPLPWPAQAAMVMIALAACIQCAQLPFHGWLIQVMEAPTPFSALLHAGVVNLGGVVLIRLSAILEQAAPAQTLLVLMGAGTAVTAALVTRTRISIKVALAWSTCAQMGFMLMQCALGLWTLALLHLLGHSLYKAHAFLSAGDTRRQNGIDALAPALAAPSALGSTLAACMGLGISGLAALGWNQTSAAGTDWMLPALVLGLALAPLLVQPGWRVQGAVVAVLMALGYFGVHHLLTPGDVQLGTGAHLGLALIAAIAFMGLFAVQTALNKPKKPLWLQRLYPWFYGGWFVDERMTRVLFRLSPPPAA
jgi:NAD(P)H-quinone oxidoreductase subunit 5